jgi:glycosyltransferase involved in cell wall biosynthesis
MEMEGVKMEGNEKGEMISMASDSTKVKQPDPEPIPGLASVIIPTYNYARFLNDSVGSVLAQTYKNLEVIIVDDGSTDETPEVAQALADSDPRVRYIRKVNGGSSTARNLGLTLVRGEFVSYLDADDWYTPERLERHIEALRKNPDITLVYGDEARGNDKLEVLTIRSKANLPLEPARLVNYSCTFAAFNPTMRVELVRQVGPFDGSIIHCEDWEYWLRIARTAHSLYVPGLTGTYRQHGSQKHHQWDLVTQWRNHVIKLHIKPWTRDWFDAWTYQQWYRAKGYYSQKRFVMMAWALFLISPQALIPGRIKFLDRIYYA